MKEVEGKGTCYIGEGCILECRVLLTGMLVFA